MNIVISGGAGFVGSHVCDALNKAGHNLLVIDNLSTGSMKNLENALGDRDCVVAAADICDSRAIAGLMAEFRAEAVIHLAAQSAISTSIADPVRDLEVNAIGTLNVLRAALQSGAKRFVFSSTSAVYRDTAIGTIMENWELLPNTPYGVSKLAAEMYVRNLFPNSVILRFGNVIGPRQVPIGDNQVLSRMIRHFKYGDKFYIHGSGNQRRDFVYVSDVVRAVLASLDGNPGTYNVATGLSFSVNTLAQIVEEHYGVPGYAWEHTKEEDPRNHICLDVSAARLGLNWEPETDIVTGVLKTIEWWESL